MEFPDGREPGWHVLIGDNGSGKSSIIRAISLGLIGPDIAKALDAFQDWETWLQRGETSSSIQVVVSRDDDFDKPTYKASREVSSNIKLKKNDYGEKDRFHPIVSLNGNISNANALWGEYSLSGWFSVAYGPFRRITGGTEQFNHLYTKRPRLAAHLSAFREDIALTEPIRWLKDLALDASKKRKKAKLTIEGLIKFVNDSALLPYGAKLYDVDSSGLIITDSNGVNVSLGEMSDGFRSIMSLTMDLLRYLVDVYGPENVFNSDKIELPGVVLVDEIDAHLHPTWQTRIGQWFLTHFPEMQFIVTTHSPLICRACGDEKGPTGTIWRLAAPGSKETSGQIIGEDFDRLVYGNILDAYSTEAFGQEIQRSEESNILMEELAQLDTKKMFGTLSPAEENRLKSLRKLSLIP